MGFHTPPTVALLFAVAFIVFLFRRDIREKPDVTGALWLPVLWILIGCSRPVSEWLNIFGLPVAGGSSLEEGSPVDACFYFTLIAAGIYVLNKRQVRLSEIFRNNGWLMAFLLYCFVAILWSDFPFVAFKRWIKILGPPTMALIVLTEPNLEQALIRVMKRCAYIIVPVSILFIKYYPEWGRGFDDWTGAPMNTGIAKNKNSLGYDCLIVGLFFSWYFLQILKAEKSKFRRNELFLISGFLIMIWWLLLGAHSSTSLVSLLLGMLVMAALGLQSVKRSITLYLVIGVCVTAIAELAFGVSDHFLALLHKEPTLTDRTTLWSELLNMKTNPIIGVGFESFWLGERRGTLWATHYWQPNEAHNGYLETYLNLGLIGLFILIGLIIASYRKARLELRRNFQFGRLRLGFLSAVVVYNWTEASFRGPNALWLVFYIIAMEYPKPQFAPAEVSSRIISPEEEMELVEELQSR
jgi:exopolysaccharide production protein ExoQ